ncbi:hypothetical protein CK203_066135 [Vitis vinifera]|uniref:Uncharacterized protein n=1 Tax=Vitis vinifera TaxID=29760 RepID=A0A438G3S0_VITVI|nr:hypothetical protein CK203_066135 [Vitis vinifera]
MARTRGAKSSSPSSRKRVPREAPVQGPTSEPSRARSCFTSGEARTTKASSEARTTESSGEALFTRVLSGSIFGAVVRAFGEPQEHNTPLSESQIPSGIAPEVLIRRPMLTQPPIEGNLDYRAQPFHSELCFDTTTFKLRSELADSFHLLRRYRMEHLLTPRDFFYPRVAMDFYQSMTTISAGNGSYLVQKSFHKSTSNEGELSPRMFLIDALLRHNIYPLQHWTRRRGVLLEALFKISEGYFFGPHHLIMVAFLYFEEKVHKKLQRADAIPLLFPRLLCQILKHLGYPSDPQLERKHICREVFTLEKWTNMTTYRFEQPELPQPTAIPVPGEHLQIIYLRSIGFMSHTADPDRVSEQPCSGDGNYSSSGADVDHPGSAHYHLEAAPASSQSSIAAEHLTPTTAVPHS